MAHVTNVSKFQALAIDQSFYHGRKYDCLLLKATFLIGHDGKLLPLTAQPDFVLNDVYETIDRELKVHRLHALGGEDIDEYAALKVPSEIIAYKPATDVIVLGHAKPAGGLPQPYWLANLRVSNTGARVVLDKTIKLIGPRSWQHSGLKGWQLSAPEPASSVALSFALAYGGIVNGARKKNDTFWANPGGIGFFGHRAPNPEQTYAAPQIENHETVSRKMLEQALPVGLSAVSSRQFERLQHSGTYDKHWTEKVAPHIPLDFDMSFWNVAPRDQIVKGFLKGGEHVSTVGLFPTTDGSLDFELPNYAVQAVCIRGDRRDSSLTMDLDTVTIDTDRRLVTLRWQTIVEKDDGYDEYEIIAVAQPKKSVYS